MRKVLIALVLFIAIIAIAYSADNANWYHWKTGDMEITANKAIDPSVSITPINSSESGEEGIPVEHTAPNIQPDVEISSARKIATWKLDSRSTDIIIEIDAQYLANEAYPGVEIDYLLGFQYTVDGKTETLVVGPEKTLANPKPFFAEEDHTVHFENQPIRFKLTEKGLSTANTAVADMYTANVTITVEAGGGV